MLQIFVKLHIEISVNIFLTQGELGMALKNTINEMNRLLTHITADLSKADNGNKAASQRVRTGTIRLEKVAKMFRKESIREEKSGSGKRRSAPKAAKRSASRRPSPAKRASPARKKATAKLPSRRKSAR